MSIQALLWRADGGDATVDLVAGRVQRVSHDELLWVDAESPDGVELETLGRALKLSDSASAALEAVPTKPRAAVLEGAVEVVVLALADGGEGDPTPLQILMGKEWIVTRHDASLDELERHRERIRDERQVGQLTPLQFLVTLLDWHVDSFFRAAEDLEGAVDELDEAALRRDDDLLHDLVRMRRRIARVRRIAGMHREIFAELRRPDFLIDVGDEDVKAITHVTDRLTRAGEAIAHVREMLIGTFDVHMTRTAQRTNDIMRVLTWASVILLPAAVLAGIMGMNFNVPLFDNPSLFFVVIGFMVLLAFTTLAVARWRRWL